MLGRVSNIVVISLVVSGKVNAFVPLGRSSTLKVSKATSSSVDDSPTYSPRCSSRRDVFGRIAILAGWLGGSGVVNIAWADDESAVPSEAYIQEMPVSRDKMGGLLEPYSDVSKGWRILKPYSWNQFEQLPGQYEMKWVDLIVANKQEIILTTAPVKSTTTSVAALGDVKTVGEKLAASRGAELISAEAASREGIIFYMFDFKNQESGIRELFQLCVAKGKIWSLKLTAPEKRWEKVGELLKKSMLSFMPRL